MDELAFVMKQLTQAFKHFGDPLYPQKYDVDFVTGESKVTSVEAVDTMLEARKEVRKHASRTPREARDVIREQHDNSSSSSNNSNN